MKIYVQAKDPDQFKQLVFQDSKEAFPGNTLIFQKNSPEEVECNCENRRAATYIWLNTGERIQFPENPFRIVKKETVVPKPEEKRKIAVAGIVTFMLALTGLTFYFLKIFLGVL